MTQDYLGVPYMRPKRSPKEGTSEGNKGTRGRGQHEGGKKEDVKLLLCRWPWHLQKLEKKEDNFPKVS